jgi:hypothetical protein
MFGKKKKPTLEQQLASLAEIYQAQFDQSLQLRDPVERYERLGEIKDDIIISNKAINTGWTVFNLSMGGVFGGIVIGLTGIVNPVAGVLTVVTGILSLTKDMQYDHKISAIKTNGSLGILSAAIALQQQTILTEAPLEILQESPKFKEFIEQNPALKERITAEFLRTTARDYKKPLEGKEKIPKNNNDFKL